MYFKILRNRCNFENLIVLPDNLSSDIQQSIIADSILVVGARYHSIVFAINNCVPFAALSYEHKMIGLLEILNKSNLKVDITSLGTEKFNMQSALKQFDEIINNAKKDVNIQEDAAAIATRCFNEFKRFLIQL